ncbi:restriction endonuclease subunit S [Candidatus Thiothrix anitrata]|uniref:Restriction endonuclease subunit S n=1 Tax=Candidatus Thiothrix anitrata TaxID=2823902 RepID=A0ABX7X4V8_9GAMM|nr:restriction endonuclease subunit S [Candidatus Thiothrix anitrata]QTR50921.1 restriction endonuclease subunit S [Candidatus Thiothrix anitrata]
MNTFPKYETYKNSGIEWLGKIPDSWELTKLGTCLTLVSKKNRADLPLLSITREQGVIERDIEDAESNHNFIPDDLSGYKVLEQGQFGMNKMKAWQGSYGVSKHTGIVSPAYFVFDFAKVIDPIFFNWAIRSKLYVSYFGSASDGVRIGQWDLSKSRMKAIPFLLPSPEEQTAIAHFLDQKTAQIDAAIVIKEQQIALLKERKQILIQQAVTQGLDPTVPMKDSGVEWIEEIPAHWEMKKVKHLFRMIMESSEKNNNHELLSVYTDIGVKPRRELEERGNKASTTDGYWFVKKGDIVVNKLLAWMGAIGLSEYDGVTSPAYDILRPKVEMNGYFYHFLFRSDFCSSELKRHSRGIMDMRLRLYFDKFGLVEVPYPSATEQNKIIDFLNINLIKMDEGIDLIKQQIEKLREYKTTLINSAVTGKIRVTNNAVDVSI